MFLKVRRAGEMDLMSHSGLARLVCDRVHFLTTQQAPLREILTCRLEATAYVDQMLSALIVGIAAEMPAVLQERLIINRQWPADWWQAFRARWAPSWWLRRWPVRYERIEIDRPLYAAICPHIRTPENGPHLMWLLQAQESVEKGPCS